MQVEVSKRAQRQWLRILVYKSFTATKVGFYRK